MRRVRLTMILTVIYLSTLLRTGAPLSTPNS
jgi:hypothetical protein